MLEYLPQILEIAGMAFGPTFVGALIIIKKQAKIAKELGELIGYSPLENSKFLQIASDINLSGAKKFLDKKLTSVEAEQEKTDETNHQVKTN